MVSLVVTMAVCTLMTAFVREDSNARFIHKKPGS